MLVPPTGAQARGPGPLPWAGPQATRPLVFYRQLCRMLSGAMAKPVMRAAQELQAPRAARSFLQGWWPLLQYLGAEVRSPANLGSEFGCKLINFARTFFSPDGLSLVVCASKNLKSSHFHVHNMGICEQNKGTMRHMKVLKTWSCNLFINLKFCSSYSLEK